MHQRSRDDEKEFATCESGNDGMGWNGVSWELLDLVGGDGIKGNRIDVGVKCQLHNCTIAQLSRET